MGEVHQGGPRGGAETWGESSAGVKVLGPWGGQCGWSCTGVGAGRGGAKDTCAEACEARTLACSLCRPLCKHACFPRPLASRQFFLVSFCFPSLTALHPFLMDSSHPPAPRISLLHELGPDRHGFWKELRPQGSGGPHGRSQRPSSIGNRMVPPGPPVGRARRRPRLTACTRHPAAPPSLPPPAEGLYCHLTVYTWGSQRHRTGFPEQPAGPPRPG